MSDKTCDCCKWWTLAGHSNVRQCKCPSIKFGETNYSGEGDEFDCTMIGRKDEAAIDLDEAAVIAGSGYLAELHTGPKFGCIRHELADEKPQPPCSWDQ